MKHLRFTVFVLLAAGFALLTGCSLFSGGEAMEGPGGPGDPGGGDDAAVIFADDFSEDTVGEQPQDWTIAGSKDYLHVVSDSGTDSGKAVRILMDPDVAHTYMYVTIPEEASSAKTLVIEHKIKWIEGKNNIYITKDGQHRIHWWVEADGRFRFNQRREDGTLSGVTLGTLNEGWNQIRLVANIETEEVLFYLNNMDEPIGEPYTYGRIIDSWDGARFQFWHSRGDSAKDIYYGDVKIWTID